MRVNFKPADLSSALDTPGRPPLSAASSSRKRARAAARIRHSSKAEEHPPALRAAPSISAMGGGPRPAVSTGLLIDAGPDQAALTESPNVDHIPPPPNDPRGPGGRFRALRAAGASAVMAVLHARRIHSSCGWNRARAVSRRALSVPGPWGFAQFAPGWSSCRQSRACRLRLSLIMVCSLIPCSRQIQDRPSPPGWRSASWIS